MADINLADAKARLSELVARAEAGETIRISRGGRPVVELRAVANPRNPVDVSMLRPVTETLPPVRSISRGTRPDDARR